MALNYNIANWHWEQGGQGWGFDPRITNPKANIEKVARDALTADEITAIVTAQAWKCVRKERDTLIAETDWVGGSDVPNALKTKWNSYRQALRDVTSQSDPENITWPTKPS
tara:strand:- start:5363 stop:5695 length:333 start_codon:yes stop_codon:yes gene_type:complete